MTRLLTILLALALLLYSPGTAYAPIADPEPVIEYQEPEPEPPTETETYIATAYTWTGYRTATGTWPSRGTAAVDPRVIPLGTKLHIEGYGEAIAVDTGGAIQGKRIDVYMDTKDECWQWGRRQVEVQIQK
jgi:3D (Asp-Asp-Asp) domain-containing protein